MIKIFHRNDTPLSHKSKSGWFIMALVLLFTFSLQIIHAQSVSISFNELANPNRILEGQYPAGIADWGTNKWHLSGASGSFSTNSISFLNESVISATFNFLDATILMGISVFNSGGESSTVSLACTDNPTITQVIASNQSATLITNWTVPCTTINLGSSNGSWTHFDDLSYQVLNASQVATLTLPATSTATIPTQQPTVLPTLPATLTSTPIPTQLPTVSPMPATTLTPMLISKQAVNPAADTSFNNHQVVLDGSGKLLSWLSSSYPYDQVVKLTWNYVQNTVPNTSAGIKHYLSYCCFYEPAGGQPNWYHNPAGLYAAFVDSLLSSYPYTGNASLITTVQVMLDYQLAHGTTPSTWSWANVPFASAVNGDTDYHADGTNDRDGVNGIQPDKAAELGYAYMRFWQLTGNITYRTAAINIANTLAAKVRTGDATHSPWPFRVHGQTGAILEEYTSNMVAAVRLFDELIRLNVGSVATYQTVRNQAWNWVLTYPMQNNKWNAYFEDILRNPSLTNMNQVTPMETARYILNRNDPAVVDPQWQTHIPALLTWVKTSFGKGPFYSAWGIDEQTTCCSSYGLGSHTARWASINALWYERTGTASFKEDAARSFNYATYFADSQGVVQAAFGLGSIWYSDGYADYIKHFMEGIGSIPEWSPANESHILRSSSVISAVTYAALQVSYTTFDRASRDRLRLNFVPKQVTADGVALPQRTDLTQAGWVYDAATGVLNIRHDIGTRIVVQNAITVPTATRTLTPIPTKTLLPTLTPTIFRYNLMPTTVPLPQPLPNIVTLEPTAVDGQVTNENPPILIEPIEPQATQSPTAIPTLPAIDTLTPMPTLTLTLTATPLDEPTG